MSQKRSPRLHTFLLARRPPTRRPALCHRTSCSSITLSASLSAALELSRRRAASQSLAARQLRLPALDAAVARPAALAATRHTTLSFAARWAVTALVTQPRVTSWRAARTPPQSWSWRPARFTWRQIRALRRPLAWSRVPWCSRMILIGSQRIPRPSCCASPRLAALVSLLGLMIGPSK